MSLFAIGDPHLSFSCDKPMDIFRGWDDYVSRLMKNWNSVVTENDTVVVPGDISWAMGLTNAKKDFEFLNNLNGNKIILKGNHDYWWNTMTKMNSFLSENEFDTIKILHNNSYKIGDFAVAGTRGWFYDDTCEADKKVLLREAGRLQTSINEAKKLGGEVIVFLHYPPISATQKCDEILNVILENDIKRCYFGHLHGFVPPENTYLEYEGVKFSLVSADKLNFCPKIIEKF
ncbi:MAG: serine/threonine protein phosphatase [Ruminococcaceae bacterium]|nr:serine/threonine protein phosphatase [Oscillospiraceae bacterium]